MATETLTLLATDIRLVSYYLLGLAVTYQSADCWFHGRRLLAAVHLLGGLFFLSSGHYALTRNSYIATYVTTPLLLIWLVITVAHIYTSIRERA